MAGRKKKHNHPLYQCWMTFITTLFIFTAAIVLVLYLVPIYYLEIKILDVPGKTGIPYEICRRNYNVLVDYNMFWGAKTLELPDFIMSEHGRLHFVEVKRIFSVIQIIAVSSGLLLLISAGSSKKLRAYTWMKAVILISVSLIAAAAAAFLIDGYRTLVLVHEVMFRDDYWWFDPKLDPVIRILPEGVFIGDALVMLSFAAVGLVILGVAYHRKRNTGRRKPGSGTKKKNSRR